MKRQTAKKLVVTFVVVAILSLAVEIGMGFAPDVLYSWGNPEDGYRSLARSDIRDWTPSASSWVPWGRSSARSSSSTKRSKTFVVL